MRDKLIMYAQSEPEEIVNIMAALGYCVRLEVEDVLPANGSLELVLHKVVDDLRNWRIEKRFFDLYPQWQATYEQPIRDLEVS